MTGTDIPAKTDLRLCFALSEMDLKPLFDAGNVEGIRAEQVTTVEELEARLPEIDVLVTLHLWKNEYFPRAKRLRYVQSVSSGTNQYDPEAFRKNGVILASGRGVNRNAVSDHAMALLLALTRHLPLARDNQQRKIWPPVQGNPALRAEELDGKVMLLVGLGAIGNRIAKLARAFGMRVIGVRRDPAHGKGEADEVHGFRDDLPALVALADVVVLACPLSGETRGLMGAAEIAALKPSAYFINVARGPCVDQEALVKALQEKRFAAAGLDVAAEEPLPESSPLWTLPNVLLTPHNAGETRKYEANVIALLRENIARLRAGRSDLKNRVA